jgi:hypothetical protein
MDPSYPCRFDDFAAPLDYDCQGTRTEGRRVGEVEFFYRHPHGGGGGECIIQPGDFVRVGSVTELEGDEVAAHLATLDPDRPVAIEIDTLTEGDLESLRAFAATQARTVVVRRRR